ncbi:MAG: hypothetical protein AAB656_01795, partial [Patescibacteria group bacterium]
ESKKILHPYTIALADYLEEEAKGFQLDVPEGYVCVRTHIGPYNIIGLVDRQRLARLMQATNGAAFFGYSEIRDPDTFGELMEGIDYVKLENILNEKPDLDKFINGHHEKYGRRPGQPIFEGNQNSPSYDVCAALIALIGDNEELSRLD